MTGFMDENNSAALKTVEKDPPENVFVGNMNVVYEKETVKKLRVWCAWKQVKITSKMRKADIINALREKDEEMELEAEMDMDEMELENEDVELDEVEDE
jgi:hypothetical protein